MTQKLPFPEYFLLQLLTVRKNEQYILIMPDLY